MQLESIKETIFCQCILNWYLVVFYLLWKYLVLNFLSFLLQLNIILNNSVLFFTYIAVGSKAPVTSIVINNRIFVNFLNTFLHSLLVLFAALSFMAIFIAYFTLQVLCLLVFNAAIPAMTLLLTCFAIVVKCWLLAFRHWFLFFIPKMFI